MSARNQDGKLGRTIRGHPPALCRSGAGGNWRAQPGRPLWGFLKGAVYGPLEPWVRCSGISGGFLDTFLPPKKYRPPPLEWGMDFLGWVRDKGIAGKAFNPSAPAGHLPLHRGGFWGG